MSAGCGLKRDPITRTMKRGFRCAVLWLATLGFVCRLLVPAGYMPAPLEAGSLLQICPTGLHGVELQLAALAGPVHAHAGHGQAQADVPAPHDHAGGTGYDNELCPVGALFASAVAVGEFAAPLLAPEFSRPQSRDRFPAIPLRLLLPQSRAPPSIQAV